ncbi:MAG: HisA/HisF-related TIM barrel protein, partial [Pseudobdellovibrionaceae bacterium]
LDKNKLVKTVQFQKPNYIGDPINAIRIFNDCDVDEIALLDITRQLVEPDYKALEQICSEAFIPLSYGGGVRNFTQAQRIFSLGFEKVILNTGCLDEQKTLSQIAQVYGSQSAVACLDFKKNFFGKYSFHTESGSRNMKLSPGEAAKMVVELGAGEVILQSIDADGMMQGYVLDLIQSVAETVKVPVIALGGAGKLADLKLAVQAGAAAVAASSLFVYHGKLKGVLINYPSQAELRELLNSATSNNRQSFSR